MPCDSLSLQLGSVERHSLEDLIPIVRGEFNEMPGMRLTRRQFRRLWNLTQAEAEWLATTLIASGFLAQAGDWLRRPVDY